MFNDKQELVETQGKGISVKGREILGVPILPSSILHFIIHHAQDVKVME